jgi:transcriptional regulator with XRE-family HTH domain
MVRIGPKKPTRWFLREWRASKGWSVRELARRMETSAATVSKLETGAQQWDSSWLARTADAFGLEDDTALLRHPDTPSPADLLTSATDDEKRAVFDFIEFTLRRKANLK